MRERRPGVWELVVYLGRDPINHKPRYRSRTFKGGTRKAEDALRELVKEAAGGGSDATVGFALKSWLELRSARLSPTTLRTYENYRKNWLDKYLGGVKLANLTAGDLEDLYAKMEADGLATGSIRQCHQILRGTLGYAKRKRWVGASVALDVDLPALVRAEMVAPTEAEIAALLTATEPRGSDLWTAIALAATTGARAGELCGLKWSDVDLGAATLRIARSVHTADGGGVKLPKSKKVRTVRLAPLSAAALEDRFAFQRQRWGRVVGRHDYEGRSFAEDPWVLSFFTDGSTMPRPDSYGSAFRKVADSLGMDHLHLHSLRHYAASALVAAGVDPRTAAARLGHDPAVMLRTYSHVLVEKEREAALVLDRALTPTDIPSL